jgi:hypothetical protein
LGGLVDFPIDKLPSEWLIRTVGIVIAVTVVELGLWVGAKIVAFATMATPRYVKA